MCILRDLPQNLEGTLSHDARGANPILHAGMEIFLFYERGPKQVNKKRVVYKNLEKWIVQNESYLSLTTWANHYCSQINYKEFSIESVKEYGGAIYVKEL
jgi:hypothetical protein